MIKLMKFFLTFLVGFLAVLSATGQVVISASGPTDICSGSVTLNVDNPQPGYSYNWYVGSYACAPNPGAPVGPYAFGTSMQALGTGVFVCYGTQPGGTVEISNPVTVRVLPGSIGSLSLPRPYPTSSESCLFTVPLCVPAVFYETYPGTVIQWFRNNVALPGAQAPDYSATQSGYYKYSVTSSCTTAFSDSVQVTIPAPTPVIIASQTSPVCVGNLINFSISNSAQGSFYAWDVSVDGGNYQLSGTGTTFNYSIPNQTSVAVRARIIGTACSQVSNEIVLQIQNLSAAVSPSGTVAVCENIPVVLTASASVSVTFQWNRNGVPIPGATQSTYTVDSTGTYTVSVTAACGTAVSNATVVNLRPLPAAVITPGGPVTFCGGGSVLLTATNGPGYTFQWKKFGNNLPGANSVSYLANQTGNYRVVVTHLNGCTRSSDPVTVTVNPQPAASISASGAVSFCPGDSVQLSANTGAGLTYQWRRYSQNIPGATAANFTATKTGVYKVVVTDGNGCSKNSNKISVTVLESPKAEIWANGPTHFCPGDSVVLSALQGSGYSFQWRKGSVNIPGATGPDFTATVTGYYRVIVTGANGCTKSSAAIFVHVNCRMAAEPATEWQDPENVSVYPNPSTSGFVLETGWNPEETGEMILFDGSGRKIKADIQAESANRYRIQIATPGVYFLHVVSRRERTILKLVRQ